jgi:RecB family exonuclease
MGPEMTESNEFILSASSVTTFLRCGQQWYFAYVAGIKSPPSLRAIRGIAVHRAVEIDMSQKISTRVDLPVGDMLDAYDTSWTAETVNGHATDKDEDPGVVKDAGYSLVKLYHQEVAPKIQPVLVEEPVQFRINGQLYTGQIDVAQRVIDEETWEDKLEIRDTKTTARTPKEDAYVLAMTGYAISQRQKTGEVESDIVLDYLVATKTPQYKEIRYGGPVSDDQIRRFANVIGNVAENIKSRRFVPNGIVGGACSWCGYTDVCPAYLER